MRESYRVDLPQTLYENRTLHFDTIVSVPRSHRCEETKTSVPVVSSF